MSRLLNLFKQQSQKKTARVFISWLPEAVSKSGYTPTCKVSLVLSEEEKRRLIAYFNTLIEMENQRRLI